MGKITCPQNKRDEYYQYWEDFISLWSKKKVQKDWTSPCPSLILNTPSALDLTTDYIPEPWWGNDGTKPLHSVAVNFNPGAGGCCQRRGIVPYVNSYADNVVNNTSILCQTRKWHETRRAKPILEALNRTGCIKGGYGLENHLSIELIPWHASNVDNSYLQYLSDNIKAVYEHCICFAANESRRIDNYKLKNVVILRINDKKAEFLIKELNKIGMTSSISSSTCTTTDGHGKYTEFKIDNLSDIRFLCIWGVNSRNDFPPSTDMDDIIRKI